MAVVCKIRNETSFLKHFRAGNKIKFNIFYIWKWRKNIHFDNLLVYMHWLRPISGTEKARNLNSAIKK